MKSRNDNTLIPVDTSVSFPLTLIEKLYTKLVYENSNTKLTPGNIASYLINLMQIVESVTELRGDKKKQLVIEVMEYFINSQIQDGDEYASELRLLVKLTLPELIDTIVNIDRKKIKIKVKKGIKSIKEIFDSCCYGKTKSEK
jgi:hypothetical protein